jgi:hypothetical protein
MTAPRRRLFFANGVLLVVVGGVQVVLELLAYGLALIIGELLLAVAVRDLRRRYRGWLRPKASGCKRIRGLLAWVNTHAGSTTFAD